jgi:hypothetical protein
MTAPRSMVGEPGLGTQAGGRLEGSVVLDLSYLGLGGQHQLQVPAPYRRLWTSAPAARARACPTRLSSYLQASLVPEASLTGSNEP